MRRTFRHLVTLCSLISLLLCIGFCVLWVRSYWNTDALEYRSPGGIWAVTTASGKLVAQLNPGEETTPAYYGWLYMRMNPYTAPSYSVAYSHLDAARSYKDWEFAGMGWYAVHDRNGMHTTTGVAPFSYFVIATALLPAVWVPRRVRSMLRGRKWGRAGLCPSCGYDLRASPERCPECGTATA